MSIDQPNWQRIFPYSDFRPYQKQVIALAIKHLQTVPVTLIEAPNGTGKTGIAVALAANSLDTKLTQKVFILTRTHPQMRNYSKIFQILNEKRKTDFIPLVVMGSRKFLCINETVCGENTDFVDFLCQRVIRSDNNQRWCRDTNLQNGEPINLRICEEKCGNEPGNADVDHLRLFGKIRSVCPYYHSRVLSQTYPITVGSYNYIFDPFMCSVLEIDITNAVIIVDECLTRDTLITMDDGSQKEIVNIKNGDKVVGGIVSNKFEKKVDRIFEITTSFGSLRTSENHPNFAILKKRVGKYNRCINSIADDVCIVKTKDLQKGNFLLIPSKLDHHQLKNTYTDDELYFVAAVLCDGHLDKAKNSYRTKFEIHNESKIERIENVFRKILEKIDPQVELKILKKERVIKDNSNYSTTTIWSNSQKIRLFLEKFGVHTGKKSNDIDIHENIFTSSLSSIKNFIQSCFDCEGWVVEQNKCVSFSSSSKVFIEKLKILLLKFGIKSTIVIKHRKNDAHHCLYHINITGKYIKTFNDEIGFSIKDKKEKIKQILKNEPDQIRSKTVEWNGQTYHLVEIKKIDVIKEETIVYDFTTTSHYFIANGFLTHNCHNIVNVMENALTRELDTMMLNELGLVRGFPTSVSRIIEITSALIQEITEKVRISKSNQITYKEFGELIQRHGITKSLLDQYTEDLKIVNRSNLFPHLSRLLQIGSFYAIYESLNTDAFVSYCNIEQVYQKNKYEKRLYVGEKTVVGIQSLDIAPIVKSMIKSNTKLVFMTGTLDAEMFKFRLDIEDPKVCQTIICPTKKRMMQVAIPRKGINGRTLNTLYENRDNTAILEDYGKSIQALIQKIPNGILIFFPSYKYKELAIDVWKHKKIVSPFGDYFITPTEQIPIFDDQGMKDSAELLDRFKKTARQRRTVLTACFRSVASEGEDYPHELSRGIFIIGIPLADMSQESVKRKIAFFNKKRPGWGDKWHKQDAMDAVNQANGRGIRDPDTDYCASFLLDSRFLTQQWFALFSPWIRDCVLPNVTAHTIPYLVEKTTIFFVEKEQKSTQT